MISQTAIRAIRGIQQSLELPPLFAIPAPTEPRGVVYTRRWVVDLLLDLAGYRSENNLVDAIAVEPAAGEGAFLGRMIERLTDSCLRMGRPLSDCGKSLIAYELDPTSAKRARYSALNMLTSKGIDGSIAERLVVSWLRVGDYLFESTGINADFVIGNPPYIRLEAIPEQTAGIYRNTYPTMKGRADLYIAFFEAALRQLNIGGTCAFICADRWMRNQYGAELRDLITSSFAVDVLLEMHNADAFHDEVNAYPAVTIIRRKQQCSAVVAVAGPGIEHIASATISGALLQSSQDKGVDEHNGLRAARVATWFKGRDPWPCQSPEQLALLRRLEERFLPLEVNARVGIGIATGNDGVFITKDAQLVEPSRLLKLAMARDTSSGSMKWSGHYLINPWAQKGLVNLDDYPRMQRYLGKHAEALKRRHTAIKAKNGWYKTIDKVNHKLTSKRKLYIADIKSILDPVLDDGETYPHHNLYFIESDEWNLEVLGGLLISAVGRFFVDCYGVRMRGGYMRFQAQYLRRIRIPDTRALSPEEETGLIRAFRRRDRISATQIALKVYGIDEREMEIAVGY